MKFEVIRDNDDIVVWVTSNQLTNSEDGWSLEISAEEAKELADKLMEVAQDRSGKGL